MSKRDTADYFPGEHPGRDLREPVPKAARAETVNLRVLAERTLDVQGDIDADEARELARTVLSLLNEKEAREVELRILKQSNTVLNARLEAAEQRNRVLVEAAHPLAWDDRWGTWLAQMPVPVAREIVSMRKHLQNSLAAVEHDAPIGLEGREERAEKLADDAIARRDQAEAALKVAVRLVWLWREHASPDFFPSDTIDDVLAETDEFLKRWWVLEGREEKP